MGSVTTGRKHLRDRNREGLERWLANRKPTPEVRAQLFRDTLGMRDTHSLRGTWLEASDLLLKSLQRTPLGLKTLKDYWKSLSSQEAWKPEHHPPSKQHLFNLFGLLPKKHQAEAMDHMLAMAMLASQKGLFAEFSHKAQATWDLPVSQHAALVEGNHALLDQWLSEGRPLQPTVAAYVCSFAGNGNAHDDFFNRLLERSSWPGTNEGLFETAVLCGMVRAQEGIHKKLAWRLLDWGVAPQGWLEVNPARERYLGHVDRGQLANRLKHARLPYVRDIPDVRLSMEADGRVFVRVQWIDAWPTHVAKAVALHRAIAASPPPPSRQKPRF